MDKTAMAKAVFDKHALSYQQKYMNTDIYNAGVDVFCNTISKKDASILDVGCGPGNITKALLDRRPDFQISGIDVSANMLELARINNPSGHFIEMDAKEIHTLTTSFDGIICGFCLPYLSKEEAISFIKDAADRLYDNGVLYISTMEGDYKKSQIETSSSGDSLFIHYHEADYLLKALQENKYKVVDIQRIIYSDGNGNEITDLVIISQKL